MFPHRLLYAMTDMTGLMPASGKPSEIKELQKSFDQAGRAGL